MVDLYGFIFPLCCAFPQLALFGTCVILMRGVLSVPSTTCGIAHLMYRWRGDAADREVPMRRRCILESEKERRASRELALQQSVDGGTAASAQRGMMERNGPASKRQRREKPGQIRNGLLLTLFR